jgi:hypothetical protein
MKKKQNPDFRKKERNGQSLKNNENEGVNELWIHSSGQKSL